MQRLRKDAGEATFQLLGDNLLIRLLPGGKRMPVGNDIPWVGGDEIAWAEIVTVGPGRRTSVGTTLEPQLSAGDKVALRPRSATAITLDDETLAVISASDIVGVLVAMPTEQPARKDIPREAAPPAADPVEASREESLETDVAPDLLDRTEPTGDDLH